jgi:hypothetical protein
MSSAEDGILSRSFAATIFLSRLLEHGRYSPRGKEPARFRLNIPIESLARAGKRFSPERKIARLSREDYD